MEQPSHAHSTYIPLKRFHIARVKERLNVDELCCHKCGKPLKQGDIVHRQRLNFYCLSCWEKAFLDAED